MNEYPTVWLYGLSKNPKRKYGRKKYFVHRLVAQVFSSPPSKAHTQVHHKDGSKANNNIKNLQFVTPEQNTNYKYKGAKKNMRELNKKRYVRKKNQVGQIQGGRGKGVVKRR